MAEIDIYKRKLFGGLTQPEFQEIVDYSKSIGGIPSVDVNRSVTARAPLDPPYRWYTAKKECAEKEL